MQPQLKSKVRCTDREIGEVTKVIVDRGVRIPEGLVIGEDPDLDAQRFRRSEGGICLVTQPMIDGLAG